MKTEKKCLSTVSFGAHPQHTMHLLHQIRLSEACTNRLDELAAAMDMDVPHLIEAFCERFTNSIDPRINIESIVLLIQGLIAADINTDYGSEHHRKTFLGDLEPPTGAEFEAGI